MLVCAPPDETGTSIVQAIDELGLAAEHSTLAILMDMATVPSWRLTSLFRGNTSLDSNITNLAVSSVTKRYVLMFSDSDSISDCETDVVRNINRSLALLGEEHAEEAEFFLFDLTDGDDWRQLVRVSGAQVSFENMEEWAGKHARGEDCEGCDSEYAKTLDVLMVLGYLCLFVAVLSAAVAAARKQLLKKRVAKGPYKVLLTATDFVFPQIPDSRRVS